MEDAPLPADGAPHDLILGAHFRHIYEDIRDIKEEQVTQGKTLARIEGVLSAQKEAKHESSAQSNRKVAIISAIVSSSIAVVALLFRLH